MSLEFLPTDVLFPDVSLWAVGCMFVSYFLGFFVRGAFGFGSNIPIVLLTTSILWSSSCYRPSGRGGVYFPDRPIAPRGADSRLAGLETSHCWDARWRCRWYLVVDSMDRRVAHRNDGVADYGSCWDGSIPIVGTALHMD